MEDTSILTRVRADGFAAGVESQKSHQSQMSQCEYDDAFENGRQSAWVQAPSRLMWFIAGMLSMGAAIFVYAAWADIKQPSVPCWDGVEKASPNGYQHKRYSWYDFKSTNYCPSGYFPPNFYIG